VRTYSFFVVPALAVALAYGASSKPSEPEPSESQMATSFGRYFSKLVTGANSEIQFVAFKKHDCKPSATTSQHYCSFTYATAVPAERLSILPARATISGMFFADDDGQLKFEMVIG
jgi:hypothetical protein